MENSDDRKQFEEDIDIFYSQAMVPVSSPSQKCRMTSQENGLISPEVEKSVSQNREKAEGQLCGFQDGMKIQRMRQLWGTCKRG